MATTKAGLRQLWFQLHKWIGILLAIVLIPLSLTGSLLVWDGPLDRALNPQRQEVTGPVSLPAATYLATATKALPAGARVASLALPEAGEAVVVSAALAGAAAARPGPPQRVAAWLDPATGKVLDVGPAANPVFRFFHNFHGHLLVPGVGRSIVGWLGVLMAISCLTGLWLWWPMVGKLGRAFRWRRQPQFDTNLHHMVGFWIALPLALLSVTGVLISFPSLTGSGQRPGGQGAGASAQRARGEAGGQGVGMAAKGGERAASGRGAARPDGPAARGGRNPPPLATTNLSVDQAIAASGIGTAPYTVNWPTVADAVWRISTTGAARRTVIVDDASGAIVPPRAGAGGRRPLVRRLHDGTDMGLLFQTVLVLGGIAPAALGITGIMMWLRTRRWRGDVARRSRGPRETMAAAAE
jgi:uncharacterized iron-regulated membrane protein